jgi:SAM-dependent methyltransferase
MWMVLRHLDLLGKRLRVLHVAPEYGVAKGLFDASGDAYVPCDFDPSRYRSTFFSVRKLDLCSGLAEFPDESFDLILHNHVLEHIPCDVGGVVAELDRILAPGGVHMFSVPIGPGPTVEDLSPGLTPEERRARFGQEDHMRRFGREDLPAMLREIWSTEVVAVRNRDIFSDEELTVAGIPDQKAVPDSHSIFLRRKP